MISTAVFAAPASAGTWELFSEGSHTTWYIDRSTYQNMVDGFIIAVRMEDFTDGESMIGYAAVTCNHPRKVMIKGLVYHDGKKTPVETRFGSMKTNSAMGLLAQEFCR